MEASRYRRVDKRHFRTKKHAVMIMTLVLSGCSTLPIKSDIATNSSAFASADTQTTTQPSALQRQFAAAVKAHPDLTGFHILFDPNDALISRLQLIEHAQRSIDLQYYIWDNDQVGALALESVLRAADRGVKVRLLIDDNNSKDLQSTYRAMAEHPNIQIRLFNPYRFRKFRALDILLNFNRITRRMHNKTFTIDHQVSLIGGRNMSNQYYNVGDNFQFSDMDVLLVGQAVTDISQSFEDYWQHDYAYPIQQLVPSTKRLSYDGMRKQLADNWVKSQIEPFLQNYQGARAFNNWFNKNLALEWVKASVVQDSADKIRKETPKEQNLNFQLDYVMRDPRLYVDLVSAYFVPNQNNINTLHDLVQKGVQIRVVTNSFKANDVPIVHGFYAKHRRKLLQSGVQLYEFQPILPLTLTKKARVQLFGKSKFDRSHYGKSSLHAKYLVNDNAQVFIGSFNFDQRSAYLNTEIGVVLNSPNLARVIHTNMNNDLLKYAYKVELNDRHQLVWKKMSDNQMVTLHREPYINWWQRFLLKWVSYLPLDKQM